MSEVVKFVVIPFKRNGKRLTSVEPREARNPEGAERLAENMSLRYAGVAAYQMTIDEDTGEMSSARLLARHGEIVDFLQEPV